jgi:hypothetical protein
MTTYPNPIPWRVLFSDTATKFTTIRDNAGTIEDTFGVEAARMHDEGNLIADIPPYSDYKVKLFVDMARADARANRKMFRKHLLSADTVQGALDLGDQFDKVITVCNADTLNKYFGVKNDYFSGRRITLGQMDSLDLLLMRESVRIAKEKIDRAWKHMDSLFIDMAVELDKYGKYRAYYGATGGVV